MFIAFVENSLYAEYNVTLSPLEICSTINIPTYTKLRLSNEFSQVSQLLLDRNGMWSHFHTV